MRKNESKNLSSAELEKYLKQRYGDKITTEEAIKVLDNYLNASADS